MGASTIARDITRRKQDEAKLRNAYEALEQKNREMEEFVYTVSHDLKSPLVTLGGMLGMLKEELQQERLDDAGEYIAMAEDTVANMCQTIADLLTLSQVGSGACKLESISLKELLTNLSRNTPGSWRPKASWSKWPTAT